VSTEGVGGGAEVPLPPGAEHDADPTRALSLFPFARWLPGADVVIAAGGYHSVHEIRASGVPAVFLPQSRRYDDQEARVRGESVARTPEELEARVREALVRPRMLARDAGFGAMLVARLLERRMEKGVLSQEEIAALAGGMGSAGGEVPAHLL
jgi:UDP:flavonoid glycosyltransferase YjiC (YdhE family)